MLYVAYTLVVLGLALGLGTILLFNSSLKNIRSTTRDLLFEHFRHLVGIETKALMEETRFRNHYRRLLDNLERDAFNEGYIWYLRRHGGDVDQQELA